MTGAGDLPPGVEAAIATAARAAFQAGMRHKGASTSHAIGQAVDYAISVIAVAWTVGQAREDAEAHRP